MSTFSFIKKVFGGDAGLTNEEKTSLFEELLFLTLSRASRSDLDISEVEVSKIQEILKEVAAIEASEKEIRTAGMSELYEVAPLEKYVSKATTGLSVEQRVVIVHALFKVISVDDRVSQTEADFFNKIATALELSPIDLMGAKIDGA